MTLSRQNVVGVGVAAAILTAIALAAANFIGDGENGGAGPYALALIVSVAVAAALFGWAIPRIERPARAGLIVAVLALLSLPVFWSGLPYVLGPAAIVLGLLGRARDEKKRAATVATVLGVMATLGGLAGVVLDQVL